MTFKSLGAFVLGSPALWLCHAHNSRDYDSNKLFYRPRAITQILKNAHELCLIGDGRNRTFNGSFVLALALVLLHIWRSDLVMNFIMRFLGYITDVMEGLPPFWCTMFPYMASVLPSIFHTAAIWLTVYLAVQRYIYICLPKMVRSHCTARRSKQV